MYNPENKTKFIRSYTDSLNYATNCETVFNEISVFGEKWGADICTKSVEEISAIIDKIVCLRERSTINKIRILRDYVSWCIENDIPEACDGMLNVNVSGLEAMRDKMVSSPLHLQRYLDFYFDKEEENTADNTYRCFCWLSYFGVEEKDICSVTDTDIDLNNMVVRVNGQEYLMCRESIMAFRKCIELDSFAFKHPNYGSVIYRKRIGGNELLRGHRGVPSIYSIRSSISRLCKEKPFNSNPDVRLSYYRIRLSGMFYRMYERERAGYPVDFNAIVSKDMEGKTYKLDKGRNTLNSKHNDKVRQYEADYIKWKMAFSI